MSVTNYGVNATLRDNSHPAQKVNIGEERGRVRMAYDEYSVLAASSNNDLFELCEIPAGARVTEAVFYCDDLGTVGVIDVGWEASSDGVEAAQAQGLFASLDVHTAAKVSVMSDQSSISLGMLKKFLSKVRCVAKSTTAFDGTSGKMRLAVFFVLD